MYIPTLLSIFAETILIVLTDCHPGLVSCKDYPMRFYIQVVFIYLSNIREISAILALTFSYSELIIQIVVLFRSDVDIVDVCLIKFNVALICQALVISKVT